VDDPSLKVNEFCAAERISRSALYKLWNEGRGPRFFYIGATRRISHEVRVEWRRKREAEAAAEANVQTAA
jgi:predicted DNA-binding transcriptional regulator AlpA